MKQTRIYQPKSDKKIHSLILILLFSTVLSACGGGGGGDDEDGGNTGINDTIAPVITLTGSDTVSLNQGDSYTDAGATADDETDGDISANIVTAGDTVDTTTVGNYTITYNVSDAAGNAAIQVTRTVIVSNTTSNFISNFVAYKVEDSTTNIDRIYTVRGNGEDHRELHLNIPSGGEILKYGWGSSANSRLAYLGDVDTDTINELYTFDPELNSRTKLNNTLPSGGNVIEFKWSPDGSKIAYRANQDDFSKIELFVVDSDGQNRVKVNTLLVSGGNVEEFSWSPNSNHLLYRADDTVNDHFNWHVALNNGTSSNQVNVSYSSDESITSVRWSPLGGYIDYIHDLTGNADVDLYVFKLSDLTNSKIATFTFANTQKYEWSDSEQYLTVGQQYGGINVHSLDGSPVVNIPNIHSFEFVPDSENIVTFSVNVLSSVSREYLVGVFSSDGSTVNPEIAYLTGNYYGEPVNFNFSPDAQKLIIDFDGNTGISDTLFVYDFSTNSSINLSTAVSSSPELSEVTWSQDSARLLINREFSIKSIISSNGSGFVDLVTSTSASTSLVLYNVQWIDNDIYLVRNTGISPTSGDILTVDSIGQNLTILSNSDTTHSYHCLNTFCNNQTPSFKLSNDNSFMIYRRVGDPTSLASDDLHAIYSDGSGDVTINELLTSPLQQRIVEYSIQPVI